MKKRNTVVDKIEIAALNKWPKDEHENSDRIRKGRA